MLLFSRRPTWQLFSISEPINITNSESPGCHLASHQFQLNQTYCSGVDVVRRFSRWPPGRPSWKLEQKTFINSESPCRSNDSHQVLAQLDILFGRCPLKILKCHTSLCKMFKMAATEIDEFKDSETPYRPQCLPSSF